jgi:LmbE family N-acetylglucosaminyl deacetylase
MSPLRRWPTFLNRRAVVESPAAHNYLLFSSVGDQSRHGDWWLSSPEEKLFDLAICYYGDRPTFSKANITYYSERKGLKLPNFFHTMEGIWEKYTNVLLLDDDIEISTLALNRFFQICSECDFWLAQPAFTADSAVSHPMLTVLSGSQFRYVNFVEVGMLCFSRNALSRCIHTFPDAATGFGADMLFPQLLSDVGRRPVEVLPRKFAVVDATPARHPARAEPSDQERLVSRGRHAQAAEVFYRKHVDTRAYNRWITPTIFQGVDRPRPWNVERLEGGPWAEEDRPVLLPHFSVKGEHLWFLDLMPLYRISNGMAALLNELDGTRPVSEVTRRMGDEADEALLAVKSRNIAIALPPIGRERMEKSETWCVVSPHPDDAALSIGGALLVRGEHVHVDLVTLAMKSFYAEIPELAGRPGHVSECRRKEEELYARFIDAKLTLGELQDDQLRGEAGPVPTRETVAAFRSEMERLCRDMRPDVVLIPLGLRHIDHIATTEAALQIVHQWRAGNPKMRCWLYEDLPYCALNYLETLHRVHEFRKRGVVLEERRVAIDEATWKGKMEALDIYRSQRLDRWAGLLASYAVMCGVEGSGYEGGVKERLWEVRGVGQLS